jgi:hypothetical protein
MSQDDLKMMIAETVNEVLQGGGEPAPAGEEALPPVEDPLAGEMTEPAAQDDTTARLDELEQQVAALTADQGIIPADAPQMAAPMDLGMGGEVPVSPIVPPIPPTEAMPKIASEEEERATLMKYINKLNIEP